MAFLNVDDIYHPMLEVLNMKKEKKTKCRMPALISLLLDCEHHVTSCLILRLI